MKQVYIAFHMDDEYGYWDFRGAYKSLNALLHDHPNAQDWDTEHSKAIKSGYSLAPGMYWKTETVKDTLS
jgi:hypothetical protein